MELQEVLTLLERFDRSGLSQLEWEQDGARLRLGKGAGAGVPSPAPAVQGAPAASIAQTVPDAAPVQSAAEGTVIRAPLVGTFYAAPAPDQPPFVRSGDRVEQGQTVCLLEAMKMMSEVPAPSACVIEAVLARDGELVEYDAPLFRVREVK